MKQIHWFAVSYSGPSHVQELHLGICIYIEYNIYYNIMMHILMHTLDYTLSYSVWCVYGFMYILTKVAAAAAQDHVI